MDMSDERIIFHKLHSDPYSATCYSWGRWNVHVPSPGLQRTTLSLQESGHQVSSVYQCVPKNVDDRQGKWSFKTFPLQFQLINWRSRGYKLLGWIVLAKSCYEARCTFERSANLYWTKKVVASWFSGTFSPQGENFSIRCFDNVNQIYSWAKNRELLPTKTDREFYESLYTIGSLLKVSGLDVS